jgi:hypothetical protein
VKPFKKEANQKLKRLAVLFGWFGSVALFVCLSAGCKTTNGTELPQMSTIIGLIGDARYWNDQSDTAHVIKLGDQIPEDSVIQTASGMGNALAVTTGLRGFSAKLDRQRRYVHTDKVILFENSILKLNKITTVRNHVRITRLSLIAGSALCNTAMAFPTGAEFEPSDAPKAPAGDTKPDFEISGANVSVHAEHAVFFIAAGGQIRVAQGKVSLKRTDQTFTKDLSAGQQYDPTTGEISEIDLHPHGEFRPIWDRLWPRQRQPKPMEGSPVQRPF